MDLTAIDEDPAAVFAAVEAEEASAVSDQQFIFATPNRKQPLSNSSSTSTTPATNYFTYGNLSNISNGYRNEFRDRYHDDHDSAQDHDIPGLRTPSLLSSPSVASSLGFSTGRVSPHKRDISGHSRVSSLHDTSNNTSPSVRRSNRNSRDILAQRLSQLAHELTSGEEDLLDDSGVDILTAQLDQLEGTKLLKKSVSFSMPSTPSPRPRPTPRRPLSLDMYSPGDSIFGTPGSAFKTRFSDLGASIRRDPEPEPEPEPEPPSNLGMTVAQAKKVIQEVTQLNEEMSQLVANLKARQEESDHIQVLLIERAERAAQRIIFLQNRISHLEQELRENDDELQYLRICLKAVEIQMPAHPDKELQRCISSFKKDYQALKRKRVNRSSIASLSSLGSPYPGSPA
ncbi:uncharacterized protein FTOL_09003 [Fusarium torulosum]|uniref:Uncharacterized protein n=1 Tax=Fusarium torulosum TaxID=33205 RepID=A0AAE8MG87_9HYPO|nr:uncharacterized protein FTOL_09003 [Fusarium torulosum]